MTRYYSWLTIFKPKNDIGWCQGYTLVHIKVVTQRLFACWYLHTSSRAVVVNCEKSSWQVDDFLIAGSINSLDRTVWHSDGNIHSLTTEILSLQSTASKSECDGINSSKMRIQAWNQIGNGTCKLLHQIRRESLFSSKIQAMSLKVTCGWANNQIVMHPNIIQTTEGNLQ